MDRGTRHHDKSYRLDKIRETCDTTPPSRPTEDIIPESWLFLQSAEVSSGTFSNHHRHPHPADQVGFQGKTICPRRELELLM